MNSRVRYFQSVFPDEQARVKVHYRHYYNQGVYDITIILTSAQNELMTSTTIGHFHWYKQDNNINRHREKLHFPSVCVRKTEFYPYRTPNEQHVEHILQYYRFDVCITVNIMCRLETYTHYSENKEKSK